MKYIIEELFKPKREFSDIAQNIIEKRYLKQGETSWQDVVVRVIDHVCDDMDNEDRKHIYQMILNTYFIPNSPCLVNSGSNNSGLSACFVVDFRDSIEDIYKTKLDFALIAKKGGGCGTTLSNLRPEGSKVDGSAHGYAGGPVKFFNTICHDMESMTQAGFREMAMMATMSIYHPDIMKFILAKSTEGVMSNTNISVVVDSKFMEKVKNDETYWTEFDGIKYQELRAKDVFNLIVEGAWKNGEPGILFDEKINDSPYKYTNQHIQATNPCGEEPLPPNGVCNLGSIDISKFLLDDKTIDIKLLEVCVRLAIRFLDAVIDKGKYPTKDIDIWAKKNRPTGLGIMGFADYLLERQIPYGSRKSLEELEFIMNFIYSIAEDESIALGEEFGIPKECEKLPVPRRNITLLSIAPTGTVSLLANCSNGIEPIFSEFTTRTDKTGTYQIMNSHWEKPYFRCAVSSNGAKEVTWEEHILVQNSAQKFVDAGVSKTINFPNHTRRSTIYDSFMLAYELPYIKGLTVYRNGSRNVEVLSPKNLKKDKCPLCGKDLVNEGGCKHCEDLDCGFSVCDIG